ncbi:5-formyltetrahydrofolate cyclo-ligase, partial [Plecturocebus cupreus]
MAAAAVSGAKRSLRNELKQRLRAMSAEERLRQSRVLTQKVIAHSQYQKSKRISIFLSMQDEIETEEIIKDIFRRGKICFIPRYQFQSNHMDMVRIESPEEISSLPKTSWNIPQPAEGDIREEALSTGVHGICKIIIKDGRSLTLSPGWSVVVRSQLTATSGSRVQRQVYSVAQANFELLPSSSPPALASQSAGILGVSHCTQ